MPSAKGFGNQVPLRFAVRQIVPATVKVTYGPRVNPGALVDWRGGAPWDKVLADAIRPLRWRATVSGTGVRIGS